MLDRFIIIFISYLIETTSKVMVLFVSVLLMLFLPTSHLINVDLYDVDVYGPMLVANEYLAISVLNRYYGIFAVYRPYNSSEFCVFSIYAG